MLRRLTVHRTFSSSTRAPLRLHSPVVKQLPNHTTFTLQRVRLTNPPFCWRGFARYLIHFGIPIGVPIGILFLLAPILIEIEVDDQSERLGGNGGVDIERNKKSKGEENEDEWIIPISWPKELPRTYYKASDPEWQAFVKFMQNPGEQKRVKDSFAIHVQKVVANSPPVASQVGHTDPENVSHMLAFRIPESPPREYVRSVLKLDSNGAITRDRQTLTQAEYKRMKEILLPIPAFWAFLAAANHKFSQLLKGVQLISASNYTALWKSFQARLDDQMRNDAISEKGSSAPSAPIEKSKDKAKEQMTARSSSDTSQNASSGSRTPDERHAWIPRLPGMGGGRPDTLPIFVRSMRANQEKYIIPRTIDPPRGSILLTGPVVVVGTKGEITVQVLTAYDLTTGKFWDPYLACDDVIPRKQRPKGGP